MRRRILVRALALAACLLGAAGASVQARGLDIRLKASDAPGAADAGEVRLYGASHALVIGIDDYTAGWPRLSNAVKDAELVAAELEKRGFDVTLKLNLSSVALKSAFEEFFIAKGADPTARLFVWYAGHGHSAGDEGFLVPADAPPPETGPQFKFKALPMRRFGEYVRLAESKHVYAVFDSCFAGTVFNSQRSRPPAAITHATTMPVRQFLTSGDATQTVSDDGTFRELFLRALRGEERADANGDGYLTASEMGLFLSDRVTNLTQTRQTPRYGKLRDKDYDLGDFVFAMAAPAPASRPFSPSAAGADIDALFWQSVKDSEDAADFEDYLAQFPRGTFASLAKRRMKALKGRASAALAPAPRPAPVPSPAKPALGVYPKPYGPGDVFKDCPDCPEMVVVPAGSFTMGSPASEVGRRDTEGPLHRVMIARPFAVGKYEVTFAEWDACAAAAGCNGYRPEDRGWGRGKHPVIFVNWKDARDYVAWLSRHTRKAYRLLTEAEWEYAARAGTTTPFHFGATISPDQANYDGITSYAGGLKGLYRKKTVAVGSFPPNAFGLHDMHGNVFEWVEDCWRGNYGGAPTDGGVWTTGGECAYRLLRGGSWQSKPWVVRSAFRIKFNAGQRDFYTGFRLARTF